VLTNARLSRRGDDGSEGVGGFWYESVVGPFAALFPGQDAGIDQDLEVVGTVGWVRPIGSVSLPDAGLRALMCRDEGD